MLSAKEINFEVTDKVAVVTGGAQGIGLGIARAFASAGARVVIVDLQTTAGQEAADGITKFGKHASFIQADISKREMVNEMVDRTICEYGRIDILINNAGMMVTKLAENTTEEEWEKVIDVNLKGVFLCAQAVGKHMIKQLRGKIINISSVAAIIAFDLRSAYCASKSGVSQLSKVLALEWGRYNIQVNAIGPGFIPTAISAELRSGDPERYRKVIERTPLGRFGNVEEIAGAAIFLASDASNFITGQTIFVDGGWSISCL